MYKQNLYNILTDHVKPKVLKRNNKYKKWEYGYNEEYDFIVISKNGTIGDIYEIQGLKIAIPQQPKEIKSFENQKEDFILNDKKYQNSKILVTGENFGCGSSREHAVWALQDYGFSVIIAPSFADIFFSNCFKNGILPISLDQNTVEKLQQEIDTIEVDLEKQIIKTSSEEISFKINSYKKKILLEGLDDIAQTLQFEDKISEFEKESKVPSVL